MTIIDREIRALRAALAYFTRFPISAAIDPTDLRAAPRYFPLVGVVVGLFGAATWWLSRHLLPNDMSLLIGVAATIVFTGTLHEDGFADVCDGFGGGCDKAHVLAIMKDSCIGAFGAIGVVLLLALKVLALVHVPTGRIIAVLVAAHAASRWAAVTLLATHDYARVDATTKAGAMVARLRLPQLLLPTVFGVVPTLVLLPVQSWWTLISVLGMRWALGTLFTRRIDGYTGDCLGATQQVCEVVFYLTVVAISCR